MAPNAKPGSGFQQYAQSPVLSFTHLVQFAHAPSVLAQHDSQPFQGEYGFVGLAVPLISIFTSAQFAQTCGNCSQSHLKPKTYSPGGTSGTFTRSTIPKGNDLDFISSKVQGATPLAHAPGPKPYTPGTGGVNMGPAHSWLWPPKRGTSLHAGIGLRVQVEPFGKTPSLTRTAWISVRFFGSRPLPNWIHCLSPTNSMGICWKHSSVTWLVMLALLRLKRHKRYW